MPASAMPLGRRPPKQAPAVDATPFLRAAALKAPPAHPPAMPPPRIGWPMDRNDQAGVCVCASRHHYEMAVAARLGLPLPAYSDAEEIRDYQTQNPNFRSWSDSGGQFDQGMDMQSFAEHLVATGRILAFGRVDTDEATLKAALYVAGAVWTGEILDVAQSDQLDNGEPWAPVNGSPVWGGHATALDGYDPDRVDVVTWGRQTFATDAFVARQVEEAWFLLLPAHVAHPTPGFDLAGFAEAVAEITDGKVVVPTDAPPAPTPTPSPTEDPLADFPWRAVDDWADRPHVWRKATAAAKAYRAWRVQHRP